MSYYRSRLAGCGGGLVLEDELFYREHVPVEIVSVLTGHGVT